MGLATIAWVGMVFVREKAAVNETVINDFEINHYLKESAMSLNTIDIIRAWKDNLQEFYRELSKNQEWQEKLKEVSDVETFTRLVAELGKEKGYNFTNEQVKVAITEALENEAVSTDVWEEIPDERLAAVAGGFILAQGLDLELVGPEATFTCCATTYKAKTKGCA
jgi:nitrogen fixation uncharacterized protein